MARLLDIGKIICNKAAKESIQRASLCKEGKRTTAPKVIIIIVN